MSRRVLEEMSGGLLVFLGTSLFLFLGWVGVTVLSGFISDDDTELVSKQEWSIVQTAEAMHRDIRLADPTVIHEKESQGGDARTLLGVRAKDGSGNVWMLLDPKTNPKQVSTQLIAPIRKS